jgi:hypothetical protein
LIAFRPKKKDFKDFSSNFKMEILSEFWDENSQVERNAG